jgi:hypothetical protein
MDSFEAPISDLSALLREYDFTDVPTYRFAVKDKAEDIKPRHFLLTPLGHVYVTRCMYQSKLDIWLLQGTITNENAARGGQHMQPVRLLLFNNTASCYIQPLTPPDGMHTEIPIEDVALGN